MDTFIKDMFIELVETFGFGFSLVLIIALIVLLILTRRMLHKTISSGIETFFKRGRIDLENHITFVKLDYFISNMEQAVNTPCLLRKRIYIDSMTERAKSLKEELLNFVKSDLNQYNKETFELKVLSVLNEAQHKFLDNCKKDSVPDFILQKINEKIFSYHGIWYSQIKTFCSSDYLYENNYQRMAAILDVVSVSFEFYMNLFEENLASFNGGIHVLNYKGTICHHCITCVHDVYLQHLKNELKIQ